MYGDLAAGAPGGSRFARRVRNGCAGLGLLVELHCWAQERVGGLTIANPAPQIRRLMALTNLESVLEVTGQSDEEEFDQGERRVMTA